MKTATRTINLSESSKIIVEAKAGLIEDRINADGHIINNGVTLFKTTDISAISGGKYVTSDSEMRTLDPSNKFDKQHTDRGAVVALGSIQLGQATYDTVKHALDECLTEVNTPEIVAYKQDRDAMIQGNLEADDRAEAHRAAVYRAMNADY